MLIYTESFRTSITIYLQSETAEWWTPVPAALRLAPGRAQTEV